MIIKRVEVDKFTKEFSEERDRKASQPKEEYIGSVRKYVSQLKNEQKVLKNAYLQKFRKKNEFSIKGYATGSDFYPHSGLNT